MCGGIFAFRKEIGGYHIVYKRHRSGGIFTGEVDVSCFVSRLKQKGAGVGTAFEIKAPDPSNRTKEKSIHGKGTEL